MQAILPTVLPDTRIFTWGYDADVDAFGTSVGHNNVEQHANDLLIDIANLIEKDGHVSTDSNTNCVVELTGSRTVESPYNICGA